MRVGLIGLGHMGEPMARNLLKAFGPGEVLVHSRRRESAEALLAEGAGWAESPAELAAGCQVVVLMLADTAKIRSIADGPDGLVAGAEAPLLAVVSSTISPGDMADLDRNWAGATDGRLRCIDAPVSGGVEGAAAGTLSIMVGAETAQFGVAEPVLAALGNPVRLGDLGAGQVAKACNQMIVAATTVALGEAALVAEGNGLDVTQLFDLLQGGYAGSVLLQVKGPQFAAHDHAPRGAAKFMVKDLGIAASAAAEAGLGLTQLPVVASVYTGLTDAGLGEQDSTVVQEFLAGNRSAEQD